MERLTEFLLLKDIAKPLYLRIEHLVYWKLLLPAFLLAIVFAYFKAPGGPEHFLDCIKRLVMTLLLLVAFPQIQEVIIDVSNYISETISGNQGDFFKLFFKSGIDATQDSLKKGSLLNFPNLLISIIAFLSWIVAYVASYLMMAIRQFAWVSLTVLAPLLILCNLFRGTSHITKGLFMGLIELSCWIIYWTILEQILHSLGYVELTGVGDWFITLILNLVVAIAMIATPFAVKAFLGGGGMAMAGALQVGSSLGSLPLGGKLLALGRLAKSTAGSNVSSVVRQNPLRGKKFFTKSDPPHRGKPQR